MAPTPISPPASTSILFTSFIIVLWYSSNIGVLLLNKYLLSNKDASFHYPILLTFCHMAASFLIGGVVALTNVLPFKAIKSRVQGAKVVVLAGVFCLTVVLGNASLKYIPVSFNQAVGSTTPFFTAILAFLMQGTKEVPLTYYSLIPIMLGVVVASGGEPSFNALGFICCLSATALRALKSVVQSILMTDPAEKLDPMSLLVYMSGASICFLLPMAAVMEPAAFSRMHTLVTTSPDFVYWLVGNSSLAYLVNLTNFLVTKYTSALTLQVLGNAKGVVAAVVSVLIFKNAVTWTGCMGYAITVGGVFLYSESKRRAKAARAAEGPKSPPIVHDVQASERDPLLGGSSNAPGMSFRGPERV